MSKQGLKNLSNSSFPTNGTRQITAKNLRDYNNASIDAMYLSVGSVVAWAGLANTIPTNWAICDGARKNKVDFPDLFAALGGELSPWGVQSTTFNIPAMPVGGAPAHPDVLFGKPQVGEVGGEATHKLTVEEIPAHNHKYLTDELYTTSVGGIAQSGFGVDTKSVYNWTDPDGGNKAHNNMAPYAGMFWIIKIQ